MTATRSGARIAGCYTVSMFLMHLGAHLPRRAVRVSLMASALVLAGTAAAAVASAGSDDSKTPKPKASSYAPHQTKSHVYGTPIAKPILHKRKKHTQPKVPATEPAAPIK